MKSKFFSMVASIVLLFTLAVPVYAGNFFPKWPPWTHPKHRPPWTHPKHNPCNPAGVPEPATAALLIALGASGIIVRKIVKK